MLASETAVNEDVLNDLSDYFHAAPIGLHVTGPDGTITRTNLAELKLLSYSDHADEYVGRHMGEFFADSDSVRILLDQLAAGETVVEHDATLLRRDGTTQRVLLYANAKMDGGTLRGLRCFTFPHPEDLRPDIAEVGALQDQSITERRLELTATQRNEWYAELRDFFDNGPVGLHIVGGDGLIKYANKCELAAMGYDSETYIGQHIARFHADQKVIDGMLGDLVGGTPLVNFGATLFRKDGAKFPVMIYSNSRMSDDSFVNTRCFTVPALGSSQATGDATPDFSWPRNEDFGFTVSSRDETSDAKPNPMTLALKYIASRKRPEETLGFLAHVSKALGSTKPFDVMLREAVTLSVPFLADFVTVDVPPAHLAHATSQTLQIDADEMIRFFSAGGPETAFSIESVQATGLVEACFDLAAENETRGKRASELLDMGVKSLLMAPLTVRGQHLGVLTLLRGSSSSRRNFGPADRAVAEELARRISFAIEIQRLSQ
ncbi:MAG TPA: PAS domain-containing protein [Pyrinomonadaceae bacterium]|nr:PAS domain-containing protein [Pyrinomonadaceae bacterium]